MDDVDAVAGGRRRMGSALALLWLLEVFLEGGVNAQGVYAPSSVRIVHSGQACNVEEEGGYAERVYTIREGETLELQCLTTGHPRPQVRWTKTSGSVSYRVQGSGSSVFNDTLRIAHILRHQGGRYYCKADNGLGSPAIKSIRVDVYYLDDPVITVHQSVGGETREQFYFERTVFLRCVASSNPPVSYAWRRNAHFLSQGADKGVEIYEPFFTQGETKILKLKNLRPQDYANYTCVSSVRNVCGIADKSAHFNLNNRTASPSIRLLVDDPLVVNPGQTVTLPCVQSGGEPPPTLRWLRGGGGGAGGGEGEELPERSAVSGGTLTLPAITYQEGGAYSCVATNSVGNPARKTANVLVRGLRKARFWITPDPYHNDDHIQIGREVKISCQVEATPPEELRFSWLKNGRALRSSERMVITHSTPPDPPPDPSAAAGAGGPLQGATSLDIIDLKFTDFGTYTCVASLSSGAIPEVSIDVNISSTTVPPELSVPLGRSHLIVQEGDTVDLQCVVSGKPKPTVLWSRLFQEVGGDGGGAPPAAAAAAAVAAAMPDGTAQTESYDGVLRLVNVSREMAGAYRCQTSQYNGFNVKPREAVIEVVVQYPPTVEPVYTEVRQGLGRAFSLSCRLLSAHPARILRYEWKLGSRLLTVGQMNERDETDYHVRALNREGYGEYTCDITNEAGAGRCTFLVTGKAYPPEFYYDTSSAVWQNRPRVYGFTLQWTQMNPDAVDRIVAYRLGIRQMSQSRWWEQEIPVDRQMDRGQLLTYNLTELVKPESYLVRLTPISRYGEGDCTERTVTYSAPVNPHLREFQCGFEDEAVCLFSQEKTDSFDWTRHSAATRNTKYTPNTGPSSDRTGSKQGFYMYIETSRPRLEGDKARLLTPTFNVASKVTHGSTTVTSNPSYCFSFYYHMYGKHIGALNVLLRQKAQTVTDTSVWSLSGNQGDRWRQTKINIHPTSAFQVVLEGVRGSGIEGDIAIDDVSIEEGVCKNPPSNNLRSPAPPTSSHVWQLCVTVALIGCQR